MNVLRFLCICVAISTSLVTINAQAEVRIRIAGQHPQDHFATKTLNEVAAKLEEANIGLEVKIFPAGQLGNGEIVFDDVARGVIDIGHTFVYSHNDPRLEINSIPYLVSDYEEMRKVFSSGSHFYSSFEELLKKQGVRLLGIYVEGFIGVATSKRPFNEAKIGPKGINIRVWSATAARAAATSMGFSTTTMNWGDIFPALHQGVIDGVIGGTAESYYTMLRDAINYYIPYNAFVENTAYYISEKTWEKLNEEQRALILQTFEEASISSIENTRELDILYNQRLRDAGVEVIDLTSSERDKIAQFVRANTWGLLEERLGKELLDKLKEDRE